jgi:DNA helicase HerA-like ATPase
VISPARTEIKGKLPLGINRLSDSQTEAVSMDPALISKHFVVLAGSGSGKTVLVRRLVEEAALLGIPSIMLDCANDLARMGDPWPARPETWFGADEAKAKRYRERAEVVVWTPGREKGNPLTLEPLPDLAAVADDADELEQAVLMAIDAFQEIVAPGRSMTARKRIGVLSAALHEFAHAGSGDLEDFVGFLSNLPLDATGGISDAAKLAQQIADSIRAAMQTNPLLRQAGAALDPRILFGGEGKSGKTRTSVARSNRAGRTKNDRGVKPM